MRAARGGEKLLQAFGTVGRYLKTPDLEDSTESHISFLGNQTLRTISKMLLIHVYRVWGLLSGPIVLMSQCKFVDSSPGRT